MTLTIVIGLVSIIYFCGWLHGVNYGERTKEAELIDDIATPIGKQIMEVVEENKEALLGNARAREYDYVTGQIESLTIRMHNYNCQAFREFAKDRIEALTVIQDQIAAESGFLIDKSKRKKVEELCDAIVNVSCGTRDRVERLVEEFKQHGRVLGSIHIQ